MCPDGQLTRKFRKFRKPASAICRPKEAALPLKAAPGALDKAEMGDLARSEKKDLSGRLAPRSAHLGGELAYQGERTCKLGEAFAHQGELLAHLGVVS